MRRLLLDTHALIWWDSDSDELGKSARREIQDAGAVWVSAASEWEITIKAALGQVTLERSLLEAAENAGFLPLPLSFEHARAVRDLKPIHKDPFDRLLVAVAMVEGLTLVSGDDVLSKYPIAFLNARK
jgi:PIN domain nuclease of toxin-antitoxin system